MRSSSGRAKSPPPSFDDRFGLVIEREFVQREGRRTQRPLQAAQLKQNACVEDVECNSARGLDREVIRDLSSCRWGQARRNLLVTGATGRR